MLPHLKFMEGESRGYLLLDLTRERAHVDYFFVPTVERRMDAEAHVAALVTARGSSHLVEAGQPAPTQQGAPLAPSA
jgi:hypothetical protein